MGYRVWIDHIPKETSEEELLKLLTPFGEINFVRWDYHATKKIPLDAVTIDFKTYEGAMKAERDLNGKDAGLPSPMRAVMLSPPGMLEGSVRGLLSPDQYYWDDEK